MSLALFYYYGYIVYTKCTVKQNEHYLSGKNNYPRSLLWDNQLLCCSFIKAALALKIALRLDWLSDAVSLMESAQL